MEVSLRPLQRSDANASVKWRNIPELWVYTTFAPDREITIEDEMAWMDKVLNEANARRFAIIADGNYVGNVYLTDIRESIGEYHIFIGDKAYWGKGIARKASNLIIDFGRDILGLHRIELGVNAENVAALSLYKSLGFIPTGKDGVFIRMALSLKDKKAGQTS